MHQKHLTILCIAAAAFFAGCSRKTVPESGDKPTVTYNGKVVDNTTTAVVKTTVVKKKIVKKTAAAPMPNAIMVNDKVAKKNIDGRLYYDVEGHRYWRNYNDGKYYLFNKKMYSDSAFIPH